MNPSADKNLRSFSGLALVLLIAAQLLSSIWLDHRLSQDPFLRGADAYYYALQANYWAKTGEVKIPDSSFVHKITGTLQKSGLSTESAVRLWETVSLFLCFLAALLLCWIPSRKISGFNGLLLAYLALSPSLLFTAIEFPKFFTMLIFVPLWFLPLRWGGEKSYLCLLIAGVTCTLHRAALPLAAAFALALALQWLLERGAFHRTRLLAILVSCALLTCLYLFFLKDRFHWLDLQRITWANPQIGWLVLLQRQSLPMTVRLEILVAPLLFIIFCLGFWRSHPQDRAKLMPAIALLLPAFFPFGSEEVFGVGERFALMVPALCLFGILALSHEEHVAHPWNGWKKISFAGLALAIPCFTPYRLELSHPKSIDPNFSSYSQVSEELKDIPIPMLVAHKGVVFFYKFKWMREAFPYQPEDHWDKTKVWRLLYKISPEELNYYLPKDCNLESGLWKALATPGYQLLREDCWEIMREKIKPEDDSDLYHRAWETYLNPAEKRPAFLYPKHREDQDTEFPALPPASETSGPDTKKAPR